MLRLYPVALDWLASLRPVIAEIERADRHLADQLRRSSTSVCLHIAEGMGQRDGRRRNAYRIALGEVREAVAAVEIGTRLGYVAPPGDEDVDRQDRVVGTLVRLAR